MANHTVTGKARDHAHASDQVKTKAYQEEYFPLFVQNTKRNLDPDPVLDPDSIIWIWVLIKIFVGSGIRSDKNNLNPTFSISENI